MTDSPTTATSVPPHAEAHDLEEYAGGYITARHGHVPVWLLVVYAVLFVWALYYMLTFWGGLGPGRIG